MPRQHAIGITASILFFFAGLVQSSCIPKPDPNDDGYSYCDATGCWTCDSSAHCWPNGGSGCSVDSDCTAGSYCDASSESCVDAGFCSDDVACPEGYRCDERSSCTANGGACGDPGCASGDVCDASTGECVALGCSDDSECAPGSYCESTGECLDTSFCTDDAECPADQLCDVSRSTCSPTDGPPVPACSTLADEAGCVARADCRAIFGGTDCVLPDGNACMATEPDCTCDAYFFAACEDTAPEP